MFLWRLLVTLEKISCEIFSFGVSCRYVCWLPMRTILINATLIKVLLFLVSDNNDDRVSLSELCAQIAHLHKQRAKREKIIRFTCCNIHTS